MMFGMMCFHLMMLMVPLNVLLLLDVLLPLRRVRIKQHNNPWVANGRVINARRLRDKLYHQALSSGFPEDWQLFRRARNKVNRLLKSAKLQYFTEFTESFKGNPK